MPNDENDLNMNNEELPKEETENMRTEKPAEENNGVNREVEIILELEAKLKAAEAEIAEMKDKFIRKSAEFENYKRRTELEQTSLIKYGGELLAMKILPVIDDFDRSQQHVNEATDLQKVVQGLTLIMEKLVKILGEQGIRKFESEGHQFDVTFHDAVLQQVSAKYPGNTVLQEVLSGYMFKDKVIRHAQVIVSSEPEDKPQVNEKEKE